MSCFSLLFHWCMFKLNMAKVSTNGFSVSVLKSMQAQASGCSKHELQISIRYLVGCLWRVGELMATQQQHGGVSLKLH